MEIKELEEYLNVFGEMPPYITTIPFEDEKYRQLMKKAVEENKPITEEDIASVYNEDEIDLAIEESEGNMEEQKIKELLKKYGADENEIENFMNDLKEVKENVEDLESARKDEVEGQKDYQEIKDDNNNNSTDDKLEEIKDDEEEHEDYLLNEKTLQILKQTKEGQDLIINAPKMAKDELAKAIKKFLEK